MSKKKNKIVEEQVEKISVEEEKKDELKETLDELKENSVVNPDLKEFFDEVNRKKQELDELQEIKDEIPEEQNNTNEEQENIENDTTESNEEETVTIKETVKDSKVKNFFFILALLVGIAYYVLYIMSSFDHINYMQDIINASLLLSILLATSLAILGNRRLRNIFGSLSALLIIGLVSTNILVSKDIIKLPTLAVMKDFKDISLIDAMNWAKKNNIELEKIYEYSDNIEEGSIITQDILPNTVLKEIKKLIITVSEGPNYDKELILSNMVGLKIDDLEKFIKDNHLKNVNITYEINADVEKDTIISQSNKGNIKRNDNISFILSLGSVDSLVPIKIINLVNKEEFEAKLYLMKNGIKYNITNEYSETIKKGYVVSQDKKTNEEVNPQLDIVNLVVSKGKKIIVPDFSKKNLNDVVSWISKNNLKAAFIESYDLNIANGKLIGIDHKVGEIISEGTKVTINVSKGALTVPKFNSLAEFYNWVGTNNIAYTQNYSFNDSVRKGDIINVSVASGQKFDPATQQISVTISYGSPVTIPYFINSSRSQIDAKCRQVGLACNYNYGGYSNSIGRDIAISQNRQAGVKVVSGTGVTITLSKGAPQTFHVYVSEAWLGKTSDATINNFRSQLNAVCPDVNFVFIKKAHNSISSGMFHPDSPIKGGDRDFTQGQTYTFWIVQ